MVVLHYVSCCGNIKEMKLSDRTCVCECGHVEDRDINAAKNILNFAFSGRGAPVEPMELPKAKATRKSLRNVEVGIFPNNSEK